MRWGGSAVRYVDEDLRFGRGVGVRGLHRAEGTALRGNRAWRFALDGAEKSIECIERPRRPLRHFPDGRGIRVETVTNEAASCTPSALDARYCIVRSQPRTERYGRLDLGWHAKIKSYLGTLPRSWTVRSTIRKIEKKRADRLRANSNLNTSIQHACPARASPPVLLLCLRTENLDSISRCGWEASQPASHGLSSPSCQRFGGIDDDRPPRKTTALIRFGQKSPPAFQEITAKCLRAERRGSCPSR